MAPRLPLRVLGGCSRGAWVGLCLWMSGVGVATACTVAPHQTTQMPESLSAPWPDADGVIAWYDGPTTRYAHGVLGDTIEATELHAYSLRQMSPCHPPSITLPPELVFEDIAPRLMDVTGDGQPEIITVQSHQRLGAQLAIYRVPEAAGALELLATTPFIGRSNRWLAPVGAADMDGDGHVEIAYIDRPHLARTLRIWRYADGELTQIAALEGLTNHRIGEDFITGGLRTCGPMPEMITANANWTRVIATHLAGDALVTQDLGAFSPSAIADALNCSR